MATAVDFSPAMIEKGRSICPNVTFRQADAQNLPFADASFDAVAMNFGTLHLGEPVAAMREAHRVLAGDGRFAFTVWASPTEAVGFSLVLRAVEAYGEPVVVPHGPDFFHFSDPERCTAELTEAGFASTDAVTLDLKWQPESAEAVFASFFYGTARTGALLRRQEPEARAKIERAVTEAARAFTDADGKVTIPMPAVLASGTKP
jgi:ubiquinone/menaquinone biosynthesis C-methylase UbiE